MKANEQNEEDSDNSIENEFSFDYSKPFTHKIKYTLRIFLVDFMSKRFRIIN